MDDGCKEETFPHVWWFIYDLSFFIRMLIVMRNIIQYYTGDNTTWHNFPKKNFPSQLSSSCNSFIWVNKKKREQPSKGTFVRQTTAEIQYNYYVLWNWSSTHKNKLTVVWFAASIGVEAEEFFLWIKYVMKLKLLITNCSELFAFYCEWENAINMLVKNTRTLSLI